MFVDDRRGLRWRECKRHDMVVKKERGVSGEEREKKKKKEKN
jgi:hypothetical protein